MVSLSAHTGHSQSRLGHRTRTLNHAPLCGIRCRAGFTDADPPSSFHHSNTFRKSHAVKPEPTLRTIRPPSSSLQEISIRVGHKTLLVAPILISKTGPPCVDGVEMPHPAPRPCRNFLALNLTRTIRPVTPLLTIFWPPRLAPCRTMPSRCNRTLLDQTPIG